MDQRLRFDSVAVVEWLRPGDGRTGWRLFEDLQPIGIMSRPPVDVKFWRIRTREEFRGLLTDIAVDAKARRRSPILHIETHGGEAGIGPCETEFIGWDELNELFTAINIASRLNLLVLLAACEGAHGIQMLRPTERASFLALIGPTRELNEGEVERGSLMFYRTMFETGDAAEAWRAMNRSVTGDRTFGIFTADFTFRWIYREYLRQLCTSAELERRANVLAAQTFAAAAEPRAAEVERARAFFLTQLSDHSGPFDRMRDRFFMLDLFPANSARFQLTLDECLREA